ncbi:serine/threonine-protein kinase [Urbifossiella limnaea]|uniref:Serine/threonine-protein kinase PknB n=1 Tax=Urbifossiella limnaea TaxID=2528023 RepID=A0A517XP42_9BACT|nr:serine/threonine-protein kinase [Urbifossiella limnaea]QDU19273.1 Serine/threonine-protein kinase PknB [Urbifossiella limnaea]
MATPVLSVRDFCALLTKSKLLTPDEVDAVRRRWEADHPDADGDVDGFVKSISGRKGVITHWQAALLSRGRADGFFVEGYKILEQLGKGQMGGVYKAAHALGQVVALKILPASRARDARLLARFQREARLLTQLDHPNVVRAYQVGDSGGRHFIAMEFLDGETLDEVLDRRKKLPVPEAVRLVRQALDGLGHLHERRTVHRDIKPSNLMVTPPPPKHGPDTTLDATLKILDVGLGRELFAEALGPDDQTATQLTVEGAVVGTPDYMSPEQAKDARTSDIRSDLYSLGCVLFHLVSGRPVFTESSVTAQLLRHATDAPPPLPPDAPPGLQAVLDRFLAKNPDDRFQTPEEASKALKPFQAGGAAPAKSGVNPAYQKWLDTESRADGDLPAPPLPKPGTRPAPALKPGTGTASAVPSWQPAARAPALPPPPGDDDDLVDVELVTAAPPPPALPPPPVYVKLPDDRSLLDLNRRDMLMLTAGGVGVVAALAAGYGLAKLVQGLRAPKTDTDPPEG